MRIVHFSVAVACLLTIALLATGWALGVDPSDEIAQPVYWEKVDEKVLEKLSSLDEGVELQVLLRLRDVASLKDVRFQRDEVVHRLKSVADASQKYLLPELEKLGFEVKARFWVTNAILVEGPGDRVATLTALPQVKRIVDNFQVSLVDRSLDTQDIETKAVLTWGLEKVGVDQVWSSIGVQGEGVRVCVSDTGVDISHPDLTGKMWSDIPGNPEYPGGWIEFDSGGNPVVGSTPHDTHGHGTHTSGTVLGGETSGTAIGMAPKAALMHALVLPGGSGSFAQVIGGIEWCVSPTDDTGSPAGQPANVHSMSWGAAGYYDEMVDPIRNSYIAGTIPVAAAGNCNEGCTNSPGNIYDSLGIGASDVDDNIASFSSGGLVYKSDWGAPPADWPDEWTVPLISAPGVNVYSSLPGGGYDYWSGTSMATPHVAGCAALMLSANPSLTPDDIRDALVSYAVWYDTYYPAPPDTRYGWGRMDCYNSAESVAFDSGIRGFIVDQSDGMGIDQAKVNASGIDLQRIAQSDASGRYKAILKPGDYNLTVERFGYEAATRTNITVNPDQWVDMDVGLVPLPRGNISGSAFNNATGIGVPGVTVTIADIPVTVASSTAASGLYALSKVPEGTYALVASSPYFRDSRVEGVAVVGGGNASRDIPMDDREWVAVMGDQGSSLSNLLRDRGYFVENTDWYQVISDPCRYQTIVVNHPYFPGSTTFNDFLTATDGAATGVVFLDTWEHSFTGGGIYYLWYYLSDPLSRSYGYDPSFSYLYYNVTQSHPVLASYSPGDMIEFENATYYHDYAWFDLYSGENGTIIAQAGASPSGDLGPGIAVDNRANNKHVLLSLHGASNYITPNDWTEAATDIFLNAVNWSKGSVCARPLIVDFELQVDPPEGLWYETFQVSVQAKNVGNAMGNYTASLYVDGWLWSQQTVSIASGAIQTVSFSVTRDPVGVYRVAIGPHQGSFRVRPPSVTVNAQDLNGAPLAQASITVGMGSAVLQVGDTDGNGTLAFDSPGGSHGQLWIALQARDVASDGLHYFLSKNLLVEDDLAVAFQPTSTNTAILDVSMGAVVEGQAGAVYLHRTDMPPAFSEVYSFPEGSILLDRTEYSLWSLTTVDRLFSTWTYSTVPTTRNLTSVSSASYEFGGRMRSWALWSQNSTTATVDWGIADAYGNTLQEVTQREAGILGPGDSSTHLPFLSFWNALGSLLASGYVQWWQSPATTSLPENETLALVQVDLQTGAYPFDNSFELTVRVMDSQGVELAKVSATRDTTIQIEGSALLSGSPIPVGVFVNDLPLSVWSNGTFAHTLNLTQGLNSVTIRAEDPAGNEESEVYVILSKPGILLLVDPLPGLVNTSALEVRGLVEPGALLTVNGEDVQPDQDGYFLVGLTLDEGFNVVTVAARDYVGNQEEVAMEVVLDTLAPGLEILTPAPGYRTLDAQAAIVGTTDPTATLTINGTPVALDNGSFVYQVTLHEGDNLFTLEARDPAGNVRRTSVSIHREPMVVTTSTDYLWYVIPVVGGVAVLAGYLLLNRWVRVPPRETPPESEETEPTEEEETPPVLQT